ncbi:MAG: response regulator transcription factor [Firmicutes bacterium]|nr:response regulator transcription factor [Bacillota bacterium]
MATTILVVDDEKSIVEILKFNLEKNGFRTLCAYDGLEGLRQARREDPDLILLDVMLPGMDGFEVCRTLRGEGDNVPIIMLTAREEETDKVFGLELGADDYIIKPFSIRELLARVKTNIRRASKAEPDPGPSGELIRRGQLVIDLARREAYKNDKALELTQREYELIKFLAISPGKVVSRQELMSEVWQYDYYGDLRVVDVAVRRLREKLENNPAEPEMVMTKRGAGYYFRDN